MKRDLSKLFIITVCLDCGLFHVYPNSKGKEAYNMLMLNLHIKLVSYKSNQI